MFMPVHIMLKKKNKTKQKNNNNNNKNPHFEWQCNDSYCFAGQKHVKIMMLRSPTSV